MRIIENIACLLRMKLLRLLKNKAFLYHLAKNKHSVFIRCADALAFTSQIAIFLFTAASNSKVTALNTKNDGKGQMTKGMFLLLLLHPFT